MVHPVEDALRLMLSADASRGEQVVDALLSAWPERHADLLRCVCHIPVTAENSMRWVAAALAHPDANIREAAITAVETWDHAGLWAILRLHHDTDAHIAGYVAQLLEERVS